jgi:hypothetical protein
MKQHCGGEITLEKILFILTKGVIYIKSEFRRKCRFKVYGIPLFSERIYGCYRLADEKIRNFKPIV